MHEPFNSYRNTRKFSVKSVQAKDVHCRRYGLKSYSGITSQFTWTKERNAE